LIAEGSTKLASVPSGGGGGGSAPAAAAAGGSTEEAKEEAKEEGKILTRFLVSHDITVH
jgi:large subunit ribosomal protein LP2